MALVRAPGAPAKRRRGRLATRLEISEAARRLVDLKLAVDSGREALTALPDVRPEKVAAARERLATGFYHSVEVRQAVAGRLVGVIGDLENL